MNKQEKVFRIVIFAFLIYFISFSIYLGFRVYDLKVKRIILKRQETNLLKGIEQMREKNEELEKHLKEILDYFNEFGRLKI